MGVKLKTIFTTFINSIKAKFVKVWTLFKLYTNADFIKNRVLIKIKEFFSRLLDVKPKDKDDYYTLLGWMISKKLAFAIVIFLGVFSMTYIVIMKPLNIMGSSKGGDGIPTYKYDSIPLRFHSGQVKILGKSGYLAYVGDIKDGVVKGTGKLYDKSGRLVYEGEFDKSMYNGTGKRYYENQALWYEGEFVDNEFSGTGILYRENGVKEYAGEFQGNSKNGSGELFDQSGKLVFNGDFRNGSLLYSEFPGKSASEVFKIYTGSRIIYISDKEFGIWMQDINVVCYGANGEDKLDEEYNVEGVFVLESEFSVQNSRLSGITQIKSYMGESVYEGNTNLTVMECVVVNQLIENGNQDFERIEINSDSAFSDVVNITDYDKTKEIYIYTFENNGLLYTFYCRHRDGEFAFWKCEKEVLK